jgi:myosin heavy subunit
MVDDRVQGDREYDSATYIKAALRWQYNWIWLSGLLLFAIVSGTALPLVLAAGLELIYLSVVPQSKRFQRLVRSWKFEEEKRRRNRGLIVMFQELPPEMRLRYADVDKVCRSIRQNYSHLSVTSQMFVQQVDARLEGLAHSYVRLLHAAFSYRQHLRITNPKAIQHDIDELQRGLPSEAAKVQEINRKRVEILTKRLERYKTAEENCNVVDAQCAAIEEVLQLVRDQSVTIRDPQQLSDQLENLVHDVEQTEQTIKEVEAIFDLTAVETTLAPLPSAEPTRADPQRNRIRT